MMYEQTLNKASKYWSNQMSRSSITQEPKNDPIG